MDSFATFYDITRNAIIPLSIAIIPAIIAYFASTRKSQDDIRQLERNQNLSIKREALLFKYKQQYMLFERLSTEFVALANSAYRLFPVKETTPKDENEQKEHRNKLYSNACTAYNSAQTVLRSAAPFLKEETHQAELDYLGFVHRKIILPYVVLRLEGNQSKQGSIDMPDPYELVHNELYRKLDTALEAIRPEVDALALIVAEDEADSASKRSRFRTIKQRWRKVIACHRP